MSGEKQKNNWFTKLYPIAGLLLAVLAFFNDGFSFWVKFIAVSIGGILVLAWLFSETSWLGKAIKSRLFRAKLSKEQAVRLSVLLDDISNEMSYLYTLSPFYVWHNCGSNHSSLLKMNYSYFYSMHNWMTDLRDKFDDPGINNIILFGSLSKAVAETARLAEFVEREIDELLRHKEITDQERGRILKEWDSSRNNFNNWIERWKTLFKEVNKTTNLNCVDHFRTLEMLDVD